MRTTVTIAPDVAELLRHERQRSGHSMTFIVNRVLRLAMGREAPEHLSDVMAAATWDAAALVMDCEAPEHLSFRREAHRQSLAVASSAQAREDQEFVDAVYDWDHK